MCIISTCDSYCANKLVYYLAFHYMSSSLSLSHLFALSFALNSLVSTHPREALTPLVASLTNISSPASTLAEHESVVHVYLLALLRAR